MKIHKHNTFGKKFKFLYQLLLCTIKIIQVNCSKHSVSETQVMEKRIFSFAIKEQLVVMLQNVNDVEQKSAPALQRRFAYV